jgi:hypothetical protein
VEYRLVVALGSQYCRIRQIAPGAELTSAREITKNRHPSPEDILAAANYAFRIWFRILVTFMALLVILGAIYDKFFFTRSSLVPFIFFGAIIALLIGSACEVALIKSRLGFLVVWYARISKSEYPPRRVMPKIYDFWLGVVVMLIFFPIVAFGAYAQLAS